MFYFDRTMLYLLPGLLLSLWAQFKIQSAYRTYSAVPTRRGIPAWQAVKALLTSQNAGYVRIEPVSGQLTDHFDPKDDTCVFPRGSTIPPAWRPSPLPRTKRATPCKSRSITPFFPFAPSWCLW